LIGIVVLLALMWHVGSGDVFRVVLGVDPLWLASGALLTMGVLFLRSWRWRILCGGFAINLSIGDAIRLYLLGTFVSSIAPGRAGDFAKAYYLRERQPEAGLAVGIATVAYDRLLDLGQSVPWRSAPSSLCRGYQRKLARHSSFSGLRVSL
jgi:uncharacterized protein (TIRG00374 family)